MRGSVALVRRLQRACPDLKARKCLARVMVGACLSIFRRGAAVETMIHSGNAPMGWFEAPMLKDGLSRWLYHSFFVSSSS